jgi:hypothetical protein
LARRASMCFDASALLRSASNSSPLPRTASSGRTPAPRSWARRRWSSRPDPSPGWRDGPDRRSDVFGLSLMPASLPLPLPKRPDGAARSARRQTASKLIAPLPPVHPGRPRHRNGTGSRVRSRGVGRPRPACGLAVAT